MTQSMRMCILFPFVSGGESGATRATRMDNHPGNPLEKHNSKRTDGTNIDLDTYLAISFRRRIKPFTLSWAAGTSSTYILSSSEAHDCVRGFKDEFRNCRYSARTCIPFLPKVDQALTLSSTFGWPFLPSQIESYLGNCVVREHKNDYRLFGYRWEANGEGGRRKGESKP